MTPLLAVLLAGKVWTYWISYTLVGAGVATLVATIVLYLVRVEARKYPRQ